MIKKLRNHRSVVFDVGFKLSPSSDAESSFNILHAKVLSVSCWGQALKIRNLGAVATIGYFECVITGYF